VQDEATTWTDDDIKPYPAKINHQKDFNSSLNNQHRNIISKILNKITNASRRFNNLTCGPQFNLTAFARKTIGTCPSSSEMRNSFEEIIKIDRSAFTWKNSDKLSLSYEPLGVKEGLKKVRRKILEIGIEAKMNSHSVLLVSYPWPAQIALEQKEINWTDFLKNICIDMKDRCIGVADVTNEILKKSKDNPTWYEKYYVIDDVHLNSQGNQVMSNIISPYVIEYFKNNER